MMKFRLLALMSIFVTSTAFAYKFDSDVPADLQTQIREDLKFVGSVQSNSQSDLHKQIFGAVSGDSYSKFFDARVTGIGLNGCGNGNAVACVIPFMDSSKMWLTKNYIKFSHPQVARLMVVFHESRHTEVDNDNWPHATCPSPFLDPAGKPITSIWTGAELADEPACDETPMGSYGSSTIMLKNISKFCTNCTDKVKLDAGIYADDQLKRIISEEAVQQIHNDLYK